MCVYVWSATVLDLQEEEHSLTESIVAQIGPLCRRSARVVSAARSASAGERRHITGRSCLTRHVVVVVLSILREKKEVCVSCCVVY